MLTLATYAASWTKSLVEMTGKAESVQRPYLPPVLLTTAPRRPLAATSAPMTRHSIASILAFSRASFYFGASISKKPWLSCWPAYSSTASGTTILKSPRSSRLSKLLYKLHCRPLDGAYPNRPQPESRFITSAQLEVGTSIRGAAIVLGKLNTDQRSPSRTPTARIEFLYLLKPVRDACIKILGEDSQILAADWLLWLNEKSLLVEGGLASLANLVPLLDQLSSTNSQLRRATSSITIR